MNLALEETVANQETRLMTAEENIQGKAHSHGTQRRLH